MATQRTNKKKKTDNPRLTISLPKELYEELEKISQRDSRSMGWVIRKAAEDLVKAELPLFNQN